MIKANVPREGFRDRECRRAQKMTHDQDKGSQAYHEELAGNQREDVVYKVIDVCSLKRLVSWRR